MNEGDKLPPAAPEAARRDVATPQRRTDPDASQRTRRASGPATRIKLEVERGKVVTLDQLPRRSIALDGYVQGPAIDAENERYSFDHHAGCVRHSTRSTAEQVRDAIVLGLDPSGFRVFVNDVDLDTGLSVWLLANPHRVLEEIVVDLVNAAGLLDAHSGAYPMPPGFRRTIEWMSEPETVARADGSYWMLDRHGLEMLLADLSRRIDVYTHGEAAPSVAAYQVDERYQIEREGTDWVMVRTVGTRAHAALFRDGFKRVVIYRQLPDGTWGYTIAKQSEFVKRFPVEKILAALAEREIGWGGGSTVGGAPRRADGSRSRLPPEEVFTIVEGVVLAVRDDVPPTAGSG